MAHVFLTGFQCPVLIAWGEKDPWEPIELGRAYSNFDAVEDFLVLPEAGHCPQVYSLYLPHKMEMVHLLWNIPLSLASCYSFLCFCKYLQDEKPEMVNPLIESFVARHFNSTNAAIAPDN